MSESRSAVGHLLAMVRAATPMLIAGRLRQPLRTSAGRAARKDAASDVDHMVRLLDDTVALARGVPAARMRDAVNVTALLEDLVRTRDSNNLLLIACCSAPAHTLADETTLARLFQVLIENALTQVTLFGPARATLRVDHGTSALVVHVDDNGPGVPRALRAHMFDPAPLLLASPERDCLPRPDLVSAHKIARAYGGQISISSSPEGGARFTVQLPLLQQHEIELSAAS